MTQHLLQKGLSRGRWANRLGWALMTTLAGVLAVSIYSGVISLAS